MAKSKGKTAETPARDGGEVISLSASLSKKANFRPFRIWLVGDTPLISHAWSQKAKTEMLQKQVGAVRSAKEKRDPQQDFVDSLYDMSDGNYGFPAMAFKNCILSAAHKDKGIPRVTAQAAIWLNAEMVRTRPALAGAICDMPLLRIWGTQPEMREDMVRIGAGLNKTANLAYRAQFTVWAVLLTGRVNTDVVSAEALAFLISEAGAAFGIGEWRAEKKGVFGAYHLATAEEEIDWDAFKAGKTGVPVPENYRMAAE